MIIEKKLQKFGILTLIFVFLGTTTACFNNGLSHGMGPTGFIYSGYTIGTKGGPVNTGENILTGEGCTHNLLFLVGAAFALAGLPGFSYGEGDVRTVAQKAGIGTIYSVNKKIFNVLWLYSSMCTVVTGVEGGQPLESSGNVQSSNFRDLVILKNGQRFENVKVAVTSDSVVITTSDGRTLVFSKSEVQSVR
ncbi:MAG: hypothetical protein KDK30_06435, partial [Leptospiraceae bacterium]|nr:hypothetical protein [Leptospiraceae bacterium]